MAKEISPGLKVLFNHISQLLANDVDNAKRELDRVIDCDVKDENAFKAYRQARKYKTEWDEYREQIEVG